MSSKKYNLIYSSVSLFLLLKIRSMPSAVNLTAFYEECEECT